MNRRTTSYPGSDWSYLIIALAVVIGGHRGLQQNFQPWRFLAGLVIGVACIGFVRLSDSARMTLMLVGISGLVIGFDTGMALNALH